MILEQGSHDSTRGPSETKDDPPPYTSTSSPPRRVSNPSALAYKPTPPIPSTSPTPPPSVNQVHLQTGSDPISGTFYIDPRIPTLGFDARGNKAWKKNPPHASFRTRHGTISLKLSTTGDASGATQKANVLVSSRRGNIDIKMLPAPAKRPRLGLEVLSRHGNIILFLSPEFSGALQLNTRKGSIHFLPALAATMRVVKESDHEAFILLGEQTASRTVDFCQLNSRSGKLVIGLSGQDKYEVKTGFWRKVSTIFGGD